jgi:hypothetical protein
MAAALAVRRAVDGLDPPGRRHGCTRARRHLNRVVIIDGHFARVALAEIGHHFGQHRPRDFDFLLASVSDAELRKGYPPRGPAVAGQANQIRGARACSTRGRRLNFSNAEMICGAAEALDVADKVFFPVQ